MTLTLILMRHAKSSWKDLSLDDHDRPLNKRGRKSARAIGKWISDQGHLPDEILCSSAARTIETYLRLELPPEATLRPDLYHASPQGMFDALRGATGRTVMMLGHNPGLALFAGQILSTHPSHPRFDDYPTGATLIARFELDRWQDLSWRSGQAVEFVIPRELTA